MPNSEKSIFSVEKERAHNIAELLVEADVNYCYYVKDNKSTIALAKFAIDKRDADSLAKSSQEHNIGLIFIYFFLFRFSPLN